MLLRRIGNGHATRLIRAREVAVVASIVFVACSSAAEPLTPSVTPTWPPLTPFEEQINPITAIEGLAVEDVISLLRPPDGQAFLDQLGVLETSLDAVVEQGERRTIAVVVSNEGPTEFDWEFSVERDAEWLTAFASSDEKGAPPEKLVLEIDATGLEPGTYETSVTITTDPMAKNSPKRILVTVTVPARPIAGRQ